MPNTLGGRKQMHATKESQRWSERFMRAERGASSTRPRRLIRPVVVVVGGLALGIGASAADAFMGFGDGSHAWVRVASIALNMITAWVGAAFLVGRVARSARSAVVGGLAVLYSAVLGYYAFGATFGDRAHVGWATLSAVSIRWLVVATLVGPAFGVLGYLARRRDWFGIIATLSLPATAAVEVVGLFRISLDGFRIDPLRESTIAAVLMAAFVAAAWSRIAARVSDGADRDLVRSNPPGPSASAPTPNKPFEPTARGRLT